MTLRLLATVAITLVVSLARGGRADDERLPDYMDVIVGKNGPETKEHVAEQNVLALDLAMFGLYDDAQVKFQQNFLAQHPVIMALFSNQGGKLLLYRPGKPVLEAPQVPVRYQIYKSVGHSALALFEVAASHLRNVSVGSWVGHRRAFRPSN